MTNETFVPMGLVELTKQVADSARANIKSKRKQVDDLEDRLHSSMDAKRDVASNYVEQLDAVYDDIDCHPDYDAKTDSIPEKEVEVKLDPLTKLIQDSFETEAKKHDTVFMAGFEAGYEKGFWKGYNKIHALTHSEQRDRELLESHGIDVDGFCDQMVKLVKDHEQDIDEDEPDNYGGTK